MCGVEIVVVVPVSQETPVLLLRLTQAAQFFD